MADDNDNGAYAYTDLTKSPWDAVDQHNATAIERLRTRVEALEKALREAICVANNTATSGRNGWVITTSQRLRAEEFAAAARKLLEGKR